jgi:hypothetical protein
MQFVLRLFQFLFTLVDFARIAFLFCFSQVLAAFGNFVFLFRNFLLMIGTQLAVRTVRLYFTQRFFQPVDSALIIMLFGITDLTLNLLFLLLARRCSERNCADREKGEAQNDAVPRNICRGSF